MNTKKPKQEKKRSLQIKDFRSPSGENEILTAVVCLLILMAYLASVSCVSFSREEEIDWEPKIYSFDSVTNGQCLIIGDTPFDILDLADDPIGRSHVIINVEEFKKLKKEMIK